jgi:Fe-S-cluster containining protein
MADEFIPNPKLEKKNNASKNFVCTQCGECCHIREDKGISLEEEQAYSTFMYKNYGVIYLAALNSITINVWPEEHEALINEAIKRNIDLKMKPKRAVYNVNTKELLIIDYFIDHDICPFFDKKNKLCTVYDIRPLICRSYPLLTTKNLGKCKYKKNNPEDYDSEKPIAALLEHKTVALKNVLSKMVKENILLNKPIARAELDNLLVNASTKNLVIRIDEKKEE